jgi:hypothetical protein
MGVVFYFVLTGRASPFSESGRDVPTDAAIINGGGMYTLHPVLTHSLKAPRFKPLDPFTKAH